MRYLMGTSDQERDLITSLHTKVASCYQKYTTYYGQNAVMGTPVAEKISTPAENEACLKGLIGEKAYQEVYSGVRPAAYAEKYAFNKCYQVKSNETSTVLAKYIDLPETAISCLKSVLGIKLYDEVNRGEKEVPYELKGEVNKCFGVPTKPFEATTGYKAPEVVLTCLEKALGKDVYQSIKNGSRPPSADEMKKGSACFDELNEIQKKFIPPPVEQVPFITEDNEKVNLADAKQEVSKKRNKVTDSKIIFSGLGPADSVVTIYIFSDPVVVTTKTDENGEWVYELKDPVTGGKHIAYATTRTDGGDVRSSIFNFEVEAAEPDLKDLYVEEVKVATTISKYMVFSLVILGVGLIILLGSIFVMRKTKDNQHNFFSTFKRLFTGYREG